MKNNAIKIMSVFVCACLLLAAAGAAVPTSAAGVIYVNAASTCITACGGSWAEAHPYLQDALSAATSGSQIWVAQGVYFPDTGAGQTNDDVLAIFTLINGVSIYGGFAGNETILTQRAPSLHPTILSGDIEQNDANNDGNSIAETAADIQGVNAVHVVQASNTDDTAVLDGFVITAGNADGSVVWPNSDIGGGMIALGGIPTLMNLTLSGNYAIYGGGIYFAPASNDPGNPITHPILTDGNFQGNRAGTAGGGVYGFFSEPNLTRATFSGNSAYNGGGIYAAQGSAFSLVNVTFSDNSAENYGGGIYDGAIVSVNSGTFSANSASSGGGIYAGPNVYLTLSHTIVANSLSGGDCVRLSTHPTTLSGYNLIEDNANACFLQNGVEGNIIGIDPDLAPLADNGGFTPTFALLAGSKAIDTGYDIGCLANDQRGASRPQDGDGDGTAHCDIGSFEKESIIYVDNDSACTSSCGGSWAQAYPNLQDALSAALNGSQIWVAQGVYYPDEGAGQTDDDVLSIFTLINGVSVYGGFAGTETTLEQRDPSLYTSILSGDLEQNDTNTDGNHIAETTSDLQGSNALHVVQASNTDAYAVLDGFVITAGYADGGVAWPNSGLGGGVLNINGNANLTRLIFSGNYASFVGGGMYSSGATPTLFELAFNGNAAVYGGGLFLDNSSPDLTDMTFNGNSAGWGGGMYVKSSNPALTNLTFSANSATTDGGGIYNESSNPVLINVTMSGNQATGSGGGMYNYASVPTLFNTILANSSGGGDCFNDTGSSLDGSSNNLIEDGASACGLTNGTNGNIVATDPNLGSLADNGGFTQTFALQSGSPAIDSGTDAYCPASDQRGVPRPFGDQCDMGSYEYQQTGSQVYLPMLIK